MNLRRLLSLCLGLFTAFGLLATVPGCMTVSNKQTLVESGSAHSFAGRQIAILPVKAQTSLAPDSVLALRNEINKRLGQALRGKLASSAILDVSTTADSLNQHDALPVLEQLFNGYETTGIIDKRQTAALGSALRSDYLVFSRLKAEKLDLFIAGKGMGTSLEIMIVEANTGKIAWGGSGEWKKGGVFGFGGASAEDAASQLVSLSLENLPQATGSPPPPSLEASAAPLDEPGKPASKSKRAKKKK